MNKADILKNHMQDGVVILTRVPKKIRSFKDFVSKAIGFITNGKHSHSVLYIKKHIRESTIGGVKEKHYIPEDYLDPEKYDILVPKKPLNTLQGNLMNYNTKRLVREKTPYNYFKLVALLFVYLTKGFWNMIDYVPFQNNIFGVVCSVFIDDEAYKYSGIDLLKKENEEYSAPSDLICDFFDYYEE